MTILASLTGVERSFANGTHALGPIDLDIREGELLSLLGPSGCGKSTTLRVIAGLLKPSRGEIVWPNGRPRIGFVFQDATLMPWANAHDNVRLPLDLEGVPRAEADERADKALARVGLRSSAHAYPRALSGGMRMRVSIARAIVSRSQLLLMDEPFAALDEFTRDALNEDLLGLWAEQKLTIVFVTHSVAEASFLSTRFIAMTQRPGQVAAELNLSSPPGRTARWKLTPDYIETAKLVSQTLRDTLGVPHVAF